MPSDTPLARSRLFAANEFFSAWLLRQFERQFASALDAPLTTNELALLAASERRAYDDDYKMLHGRESFRASYNQRFVDQRVSELMASHPGGQQNAMTAGQWRAIVTEEDSTLVVAAAGSGKTTTILAKIEYLVARGFARPGEICVLAYNKDAANTVREGLEARNIHGVTASTRAASGRGRRGSAVPGDDWQSITSLRGQGRWNICGRRAALESRHVSPGRDLSSAGRRTSHQLHVYHTQSTAIDQDLVSLPRRDHDAQPAPGAFSDQQVPGIPRSRSSPHRG
ncbi:MAG: UvrD-helicase domain-containing protein [Proteobacteria bacterium]|nr:UvrD-helicase domain-containing protein [Pseudomonadota bacterium]